jgi:hypothetical protein
VCGLLTSAVHKITVLFTYHIYYLYNQMCYGLFSVTILHKLNENNIGIFRPQCLCYLLVHTGDAAGICLDCSSSVAHVCIWRMSTSPRQSYRNDDVVLYVMCALMDLSWRKVQGEHKWSLQLRKCIVKQWGKIIHPNFQTLDCNCQRFESKIAHTVAMICHQGHYSQENGDTSAKSKMCPVVW